MRIFKRRETSEKAELKAVHTSLDDSNARMDETIKRMQEAAEKICTAAEWEAIKNAPVKKKNGTCGGGGCNVPAKAIH
jgi:hypothetical protein